MNELINGQSSSGNIYLLHKLLNQNKILKAYNLGLISLNERDVLLSECDKLNGII